MQRIPNQQIRSQIPGIPFWPGQIQPLPNTNEIKGNKDDLKARNRVAAKKWRDRKDNTMHNLEEINDSLREQALDLRNQSMSLQAENKILENELRFFQVFMTRIMNVVPKANDENKSID